MSSGHGPGSAPTTRREVRAHGRVQDVFYRDSTRREAERLGVSGWVRNLSDGTVQAVFEGPLPAVEQLVAFCRSGPPKARVERLEVEERPPEGLHGFEVR